MLRSTIGALAILLVPCLQQALAEAPHYHTGCQAYTFRNFTVHEAIEKTAETGGTVIEFYLGQRLSSTDPSGLGLDITEEQATALEKQLKKHHIKATGCYTDIPADEAAARKIFDWARKIGLKSLTTESDGSINTIEKMVKEFDITVAFHEHKRSDNPAYKLWNPSYLAGLLKGRDTRIGACADTGHWASSGIVPIDGLKELDGRIISLHLKDRAEIGRETPDVVLGTGVTDVAGTLAELNRQKFDGFLYIEYESNPADNVTEVKKCIDFIRSQQALAK